MLFGEKVKNKKGLPDLTLSLPSLQGNMGDNFAQSNRSSMGRGKMNEPDILTYPSVKEVRGCSFCNENNWFCGDASPKPDPHCFLQYQAIHTGQSLSGAFWDGLVLSAKNICHWHHPFQRHSQDTGDSPLMHTVPQLIGWTAEAGQKSVLFFFLMDIKIVQAFLCFLKRQKANPDTPSMRKNLCWSEPPTWRCNDHFPSQMLGGSENMVPNCPKHTDFSLRLPLLSPLG